MSKFCRLLSILLLLAALCSGCAYIPARDAGSLMRPPRPRDSEARAIQALLRAEYAGKGDVVFRQPLRGGDAVAYQDLGEGPQPRVAAAFFSVENGLPPALAKPRMALLLQADAGWRLLCEEAFDGTDILSMEFRDFGGPGLLVCWKQGEEKRFTLYRYDPQARDGGLLALCEGLYDVFQWADLDGDGIEEFFYALHNPNRAGAYQYDEEKARFRLMGELELDSMALTYCEPLRTQAGGKEALLFDADAPDGRCTEAVYWDGKALRAPFGSGSTFRGRRIPLREVEGRAQIPSQYPMPGAGNAVYLVRWSEIGEAFSLYSIAENQLYLNTTQWIALPPDLVEVITARPDPEDPRTLRFYEWDAGTRREGKELFWLYSNGSETDLLLRNELTEDGRRAGIDSAFLAEIHNDIQGGRSR